MSAIEQPAARSGRITFCSGAVRMSADSAMKCTPQKTMYSASGRAAASRASLKESPVTSANSDDLVALVVVAEHEHPVAERGLGGLGPRDQVGVGGGGQGAGAVDAALGARVGAAAQDQQGQVGRRHTAHLFTGSARLAVRLGSEEVAAAAGTAPAASCPEREVALGAQRHPGTPSRRRPPTGWRR